MILQGKAKYPVREVMLHCAAIKTGQFNGLKPIAVWSTINRWHIQRGFKNGFGYHGLFMPDGRYLKARPFDMIGAGCVGKNQGVLHLLLVESREVKGIRQFADYFTEEQRTACRSLIRYLPGIERVSGHNDYAAKLCPGFKVHTEDWL